MKNYLQQSSICEPNLKKCRNLDWLSKCLVVLAFALRLGEPAIANENPSSALVCGTVQVETLEATAKPFKQMFFKLDLTRDVEGFSNSDQYELLDNVPMMLLVQTAALKGMPICLKLYSDIYSPKPDKISKISFEN